MYLCVNLFFAYGDVLKLWSDFDLERGGGSSILPPGYAKILRRCINASSNNNKRDNSSAMSFANSSGILAAAAHWISFSFCPCVSLSFFWATLSPCDVWGLAATLAPALAPCPPHAVLALCALRFPLHFMCYLLSQQQQLPPLTIPSPSLAPSLQCVGCPTSRFLSLLHHMTYEWFMFMAPLQARSKVLRNYVYAMLQDIWMCI